MTTGEKIRYYRQLRHLTQDELGKKCLKPQDGKPNATIAGSTIRSYERGLLNPKPDTLKIIASALNVNWGDLISDDLTELKTLPSGEIEQSIGRIMTKYLESMDSNDIKLWISEQVQRRQHCGGEQAGRIADLIISEVTDQDKADMMVSVSRLTDIAPPEYADAAFAVLKSGFAAAIIEKAREKGLDVTLSEQEFDVWEKAFESENSSSKYTIGVDLDAEEALSLVESYVPEKENPPQDQEDPEAE